MRNARGVGQQMVQRDSGPLRRPAGQPAVYGVVRASRPDSARRRAAAAANCLLTEQSWNRVAGVHGVPAAASAGPAASSVTTVPPLVTMATPHRSMGSILGGSGDQGADPNELVVITDPPAATAPAAGESFRTVRAARFAEVLRGVSFTPAR